MAPYSGIPSQQPQITLALAPKFTAVLSIMGSSYIIIDVLSKQRRKHSLQQHGNTNTNKQITYHRLMIGLSIFDLLMSIGLFTSTWPMPVDTPHVYGAVGNTQTCALVGFMETAGVAAVMYNASLSCYYLVRIRYGWPVSRIQRHLEVYMHVIPIAFALFTMFAGLFLKLFNSGLFDCWIAPYPQGCTESWRFNRQQESSSSEENSNPCIRGDNASLYQWVFDLIPKWSCILLVTINMVLVHQAVLKQERSTLRRTFRAYGQHTAALSTANDSISTRPGASMTNATAITRTNTNTAAAANDNANANANAMPPTTESNGNDNANATTTPPTLSRTTRHHVAHPPSARLSRRLARQSYLYVGALYITYVPVIITRAYELTHGYVHYEMLLTISITIPLQGFWNVLVYLRPRYLAKQDERRRQEQLARQRLSALRSLSSHRTAAGSATEATTTNPAVNLRMFLQTISQVVQEGCLENEEQEATDADDDEQQEANNDTIINNVISADQESLAAAGTALAATTTEDNRDDKPSNSAHTKEPPPPPPSLSSVTDLTPTSIIRENT